MAFEKVEGARCFACDAADVAGLVFAPGDGWEAGDLLVTRNTALVFLVGLDPADNRVLVPCGAPPPPPPVCPHLRFITSEVALTAAPVAGDECVVRGPPGAEVSGSAVPGRYAWTGTLWIPSDTLGPCYVGGFENFNRALSLPLAHPFVSGTAEPVFGPGQILAVAWWDWSLQAAMQQGVLWGHGLVGVRGWGIRIGNGLDPQELDLESWFLPGFSLPFVGTSPGLGPHKFATGVDALTGLVHYALDGVAFAPIAGVNWAAYVPPAVDDPISIGIGQAVFAFESLQHEQVGDTAAWKGGVTDADLIAVTSTPEDGWIHGIAGIPKIWAMRPAREAQGSGACYSCRDPVTGIVLQAVDQVGAPSLLYAVRH